MKQNFTNQDKKPHSRKTLLFSLAAAALAVTGGLLCWLRNTRPEVQSAASVPEAVTESNILETDLSAAASVQTEISILESAPVSVSETMTETVAVAQESVNSEMPTETAVPAESESAAVTETETHSETESEQPSNEETSSETETESTESATEASGLPATETVPESVTESASSAEEITYRSVLKAILKSQSFQSDSFETLNDSDMAENEFAVYDIDNDGSEELIIRWSNTASASVTGIIYGRDHEGNIYNKLKTTPYMRFYSNGMIEADNLYKSPLSGDFWGYTLYQYDTATGSYSEVASVEAWSKEAMNQSENPQGIYPDYADFSEFGYVYLISRSDDENTGLSDPLDVTNYQTWHESYLGNAIELSLPFQKFTEANIENIQ